MRNYPDLQLRRTLIQAFAWLVAVACVQYLKFDIEEWASVLAALLLVPVYMFLVITGMWIAFKLIIGAIENSRVMRFVAIAILVAMPATWWFGHEVAVRIRLHRYQSQYDQIIAVAMEQGPESAKSLADSMGIAVAIDTNDSALRIGFIWGISFLDSWNGPVWDAQSAASGRSITRGAARSRFVGFGELTGCTPLGSGWYFCSFT